MSSCGDFHPESWIDDIEPMYRGADPAHDFSHILRVFKNAQIIGLREGGDMLVLLWAALLHDAGSTTKLSPGSEESESQRRKAADDLLKEVGLPEEVRAEVLYAVEVHRFSQGIKPVTLEAKILQDADRLDAIGAIGIARVFMTGGSLCRALYNPQDPFCKTREPDDKKWNLDHFYRKLLQLESGMHTKTARELAGRRSAVLRRYLADLEEEIGIGLDTRSGEWMIADEVESMKYVLHPKSEIEARIKKLQSLMGEMTGALLFESIDLGYFSGTAQDGLIYIPRDDPPVLMIRKSLERAREESPLEVRAQRSLKSIKSDLDLPGNASIGLELDVLPYNNYARLEKALGKDVRFIDISEKIKHIRSVKSDFEIQLIREAARILDAGISTVPDHLQEGMREIDLAVNVESAMRVLGHSGRVAFHRFNQALPMGHLMAGENAAFPSFVASPTGGRGMSLFFPQGPGFRKIKRNEPVLVDFAGSYNGYIADETRIFCLGKLSRELEEAHNAALQIEETIAKLLVSGKTGREIFEICEAEGARLGYQDFLGGPPGGKAGFVGHGVGLEIDEYPVLGPVDHCIAENMTIAVEPKMIYPDVGVVGIEDTFLTGRGGAERLTRLPQEIWRV